MPVVPSVLRVSRVAYLLRFQWRRGFAAPHGFRRPVAIAASVAVAAAALAGGSAAFSRNQGFSWRVRSASGDYATRAATSARLLEHTFYNGTGLWHMCAGLPMQHQEPGLGL